jgi:hypothetical protein
LPIRYFSNTKVFETWYASFYKLIEMHDGFIMILDEVLNLLFNIISTKRKNIMSKDFFFPLILHVCSLMFCDWFCKYSTFVLDFSNSANVGAKPKAILGPCDGRSKST